ncbi:MAG: hypothetical protein ACE5KI_00970 [Dehalococcoidia bacterium]
MASSLSSQTYEVPDTIDAIEFYYREGLTDGLPVVPPTPERVAEFLDYVRKEPQDVVGSVPARHRVITAEKIAINAVMAGCLPEYMPVLVTAIEAMSEEQFNLHGTSASTAGSGHMVIVHGPIARELDINFANNLFGPTRRVNATIGRAIRLIIMNVCGSIPGVLDKSTFGHPGKYSYCIAEDEELSPWEPLHVERGLSLESSAVTVYAANAPHQFDDHSNNTAEGILTSVAKGMLAQAYPNGPEFMVILTPELIGNIRNSGWSKQQVKEYLYEKTKRPASFWGELGRGSSIYHTPETAGKEMAAVASPDSIMVLVAGGSAGAFFCCVMPWGAGFGTLSVTRPIQSY